jgi:hypothetical protein
MQLAGIQLALSFAEDSEPFASILTSELDRRYTIYYYKNFLSEQRGQRISELAEAIYSSVPVVILRTSGWLTSAACNLERDIVNRASNPLLVFDFVGKAISDLRPNGRTLFEVKSNTAEKAAHHFAINWASDCLRT